jgi:hypothetical protein
MPAPGAFRVPGMRPFLLLGTRCKRGPVQPLPARDATNELAAPRRILLDGARLGLGVGIQNSLSLRADSRKQPVADTYVATVGRRSGFAEERV